jgi:hypothetical protein
MAVALEQVTALMLSGPAQHRGVVHLLWVLAREVLSRLMQQSLLLKDFKVERAIMMEPQDMQLVAVVGLLVLELMQLT